MKTNEFTFTMGGNKVNESFMAKTYGKEVVSELKNEARAFGCAERWCKTAVGGRYAIRVALNGRKITDIRSQML